MHCEKRVSTDLDSSPGTLGLCSDQAGVEEPCANILLEIVAQNTILCMLPCSLGLYTVLYTFLESDKVLLFLLFW